MLNVMQAGLQLVRTRVAHLCNSSITLRYGSLLVTEGVIPLVLQARHLQNKAGKQGSKAGKQGSTPVHSVQGRYRTVQSTVQPTVQSKV